MLKLVEEKDLRLGEYKNGLLKAEFDFKGKTLVAIGKTEKELVTLISIMLYKEVYKILKEALTSTIETIKIGKYVVGGYNCYKSLLFHRLGDEDFDIDFEYMIIKDDKNLDLITFDDGAFDFEKFEVLDSSKIHLLQC